MRSKEDEEYDLKLELVKEWWDKNIMTSGFATWLAPLRRTGETLRQTVERIYDAILSGNLRR